MKTYRCLNISRRNSYLRYTLSYVTRDRTGHMAFTGSGYIPANLCEAGVAVVCHSINALELHLVFTTSSTADHGVPVITTCTPYKQF